MGVRHRYVEVGAERVFWREAGPVDAPVVVLLHGFPASSFQWRFLIPALAERWRVVAPDLPGFGFSGCPERSSFDGLAGTVRGFLAELGIERYALVVHDYGAQVGFRLAMAAPERVAALVVLNSEAHFAEGRSEIWRDGPNWRDPSQRDGLFTEDAVRGEFLEQLPADVAERIDPAAIALAVSHLRDPAVVEAMLDLHLDYPSNVANYPAVQAYLREHRPPTLVLWGKKDQFYGPEAATAYRQELPGVQVRMLDGGHWSIETNGPEIAAHVHDFLSPLWTD